MDRDNLEWMGLALVFLDVLVVLFLQRQANQVLRQSRGCRGVLGSSNNSSSIRNASGSTLGFISHTNLFHILTGKV
jgi:hypothetical protein